MGTIANALGENCPCELSCGLCIRVPTSKSKGTYEANRGRRRDSGKTAGAKERVAPKWLDISWPSKGTEKKMDMIGKEYDKYHLSRTQGSSRALSLKEGVLSIPMTKTRKGTLGPE